MILFYMVSFLSTRLIRSCTKVQDLLGRSEKVRGEGAFIIEIDKK